MLVVFYVPSIVRSFRDGTSIYCPLQRTRGLVFTPFPLGIEPRAVAWQSITLPLRHANSTKIYNISKRNYHFIHTINKKINSVIDGALIITTHVEPSVSGA